ncbi:hypothetical protein DFH09DRAFT_1311495 [Mycena vulgaris]|nr:hypothetical protein DFH09DRAFT_1311495 [Mycena vulgaris]
MSAPFVPRPEAELHESTARYPSTPPASTLQQHLSGTPSGALIRDQLLNFGDLTTSPLLLSPIFWRRPKKTHARNRPSDSMNTIKVQQQINSNYYFNLIAFTLLFYDYFLTLDWEVARYWGSILTVPNVLFFLNRYGTLFGTIPVVFQFFWTADPTPNKLAVLQICQHLHSYHQYFAVVTQILIGIMLILRTYALYERNNRVLALMVCISAGVIAVGIWSVLVGPGAVSGNDATELHLFIGCSSSVSASQSVGLAAAWAGMGVFDCTIFSLTLYRALSKRRSQGLDLLTVLLRDGTIYFGVMVASNVSNILTFIYGGPYTRGIPTTFINVISSIMISRLMLNLRDPSLSTMSGRFSGSTTLTGNAMFSTYINSVAPPERTGQGTTRKDNDIELEPRLYP